MVKCNVLVEANVTNPTILGVEIADRNQSAQSINGRGYTVINGVSCVYKQVEISDNINTFINNYEKYYLSGNAGTGWTVVVSNNAQLNENRVLSTFDRSYPYACNNLNLDQLQ